MLQGLKRFYRAHANLVPTLFQQQQNLSLEVRNALRMVYEHDFRGLTLLGLPATPRFVDVGGNYGQSIGAMRALFRTARIDSFEPNPGAFAYLQRRWGRVGGITLHGVGLGGEPGSLVLYVPEGGGISFSGMASMSPPEHALADLRQQGYTFLDENNLRIAERRIEVKRLDEFGLAPDVIKIDVEGHELGVLRGAVRTLSRHHPPLLIERGERPEIMKFLADLGYRRFVYTGEALTRSDDLPALNCYFVAQS